MKISRDVYDMRAMQANGDSVDDTDFIEEELHDGVNIIESLSKTGVISKEEGNRRKFLIQAYFEYNSTGVNLEEIESNWKQCFHGLHQCWAGLWRWIYYTEQVD